MRIYPGQIGEGNWRHFEWTFTTPDSFPGEATFLLSTRSERPIEVRNPSLRRHRGDDTIPRYHGYRNVATLPPVYPGDSEIVIYENIQSGPVVPTTVTPSRQAESFTWSFDPTAAETVPAVGFSAGAEQNPIRWLEYGTVPSLGVYGLGLLHFGFRRIRRNRNKTL
jgi:hypothetical protein